MKKWLILLFTAIATTTAAAQSDEEITAPVEPLQSNESEGEEIQELAPEAPVVINERIDEEPEFDIPAPPDKAPETIEDLQLQLEKNTKTYKMYKAFQYTSVTVAGIGLLLVILDAFIDTGSEYPVACYDGIRKSQHCRSRCRRCRNGSFNRLSVSVPKIPQPTVYSRRKNPKFTGIGRDANRIGRFG